MQPTQNADNKNALLDYVASNRNKGTLNIKEFKKLLKNKDININAQDKDGNTALHILVTGGGTFEYAQLLLRKGAKINLSNAKNQTVLDIILTQKDQPQLLFLIATQYKNLPLPTKWADNSELQDVAHLIDFQFPTNTQFGKFFTKIINNFCNFYLLDTEEIEFLKQCQIEKSEEGLDQNTINSDTESLPSPKKSSLFDFGDEKISKLVKEFINNFADIIELKYRFDRSKSYVLDESRQDPLIISLKNYLQNNATVEDLITILQAEDKEPNLPAIKPILKAIDYEELSLSCAQKKAAEMLKSLIKAEAKQNKIDINTITLPEEIIDKITGFLDETQATETASSIYKALRPKASAKDSDAQKLQPEAQLVVGK